MPRKIAITLRSGKDFTGRLYFGISCGRFDVIAYCRYGWHSDINTLNALLGRYKRKEVMRDASSLQQMF